MMIFIRSHFEMVCINTNLEGFAIYTEDYDGDRFGNPVEQSVDSYTFGHLIIETHKKRYIFKKVYEAYSWACSIVDYIEEHKDDLHIFIDLNKLRSYIKDEYEEFEGFLEVEAI